MASWTVANFGAELRPVTQKRPLDLALTTATFSVFYIGRNSEGAQLSDTCWGPNGSVANKLVYNLHSAAVYSLHSAVMYNFHIAVVYNPHSSVLYNLQDGII